MHSIIMNSDELGPFEWGYAPFNQYGEHPIPATELFELLQEWEGQHDALAHYICKEVGAHILHQRIIDVLCEYYDVEPKVVHTQLDTENYRYEWLETPFPVECSVEDTEVEGDFLIVLGDRYTRSPEGVPMHTLPYIKIFNRRGGSYGSVPFVNLIRDDLIDIMYERDSSENLYDLFTWHPYSEAAGQKIAEQDEYINWLQKARVALDIPTLVVDFVPSAENMPQN